MNKSWFRWKYVAFGYIFLMMAYVINHNERFLVDSSQPVWKHYEPFKWWLLVHGVVAACALFLGPMQFSDRLRLRYTKLHRVVGRVYVADVLIGSPIRRSALLSSIDSTSRWVCRVHSRSPPWWMACFG